MYRFYNIVLNVKKSSTNAYPVIIYRSGFWNLFYNPVLEELVIKKSNTMYYFSLNPGRDLMVYSFLVSCCSVRLNSRSGMSTVNAINVSAKANTASLKVTICSNLILGANALDDTSNNSC